MPPVKHFSTAARCWRDFTAGQPDAECPSRLGVGTVVWFALVSFLPLGWLLLRQPSGGRAAFFGVIAHVAALTFWAVRLRKSGLAVSWTSVTLFGLTSAFAANPSGRLDIGALGEAVFLYLLLSLFSAYDRQPGLQALASAALLLSAGVLTKPPVAISCLLVSLGFFLLHRRKSVNGTLSFALLMFTPVTLCAATAALLAFLTRGAIGAPVLVPGGSLFQRGFFSTSHLGAFSAPLSAGLAIHWLAFPVAVVLYRLCIRRTDACDVAFGFMLTAGAVLSFFPHMPEPLHRGDMFYLALGGAAAPGPIPSAAPPWLPAGLRQPPDADTQMVVARPREIAG
jgi:hypothetical protein